MKVYCDLDGVLVDFQAGMIQIFGEEYSPAYIPDDEWKASKSYQMLVDGTTVDWWANLSPMPDYQELWDFLKPYNPKILTAYAVWSEKVTDHCIEGKCLWNKKWTQVSDRYFHIVHKDAKSLYATTAERSNVLIDDMKYNIDAWEKAGGIGILHTSAKETIRRLKELEYGN